MAPVPLELEVRNLPAIVVASHITAVVYLTSTLFLGLYKSYQGLNPSQDIRLRIAKRARLIPVFAVLAGLGLGLAGYSSARYAALSYQVWADERGIGVPGFLGGSLNSTSTNEAPFYLRRWLTDTALYQDAVEIVAEKTRRFWWGQQIDLSMVSWTLFLAIEGNRRRIPFLGAYLSLAHLVSLSFAQNMFYLTLLLTPAPLPGGDGVVSTRFTRLRDRVFPPKPNNWCPSPALFLSLLGLNYGAIYLLPYAAGTPSFTTTMVAARLLTFALLAMPTVVPESWGTVHPHPHSAYGTYNTLFRFASGASVALHAKASFVSLAFNTPDAYYHRHSIRIPFDTAERTRWERTTTSIGKVLGATADHPVVAAIGRDVLLSAVSLGLWAAVRALDSGDILLSAIPFYKSSSSGKSLADEVASLAGSESAALSSTKTEDAADSVNVELEAPAAATPRRRGRAAAAKTRAASDASEAAAASGASTRRRGRGRKAKDLEEVPGDETYEPTAVEKINTVEGDVLPAEDVDWEAAALAWGLTAVGGLGCAASGVLGGECISR